MPSGPAAALATPVDKITSTNLRISSGTTLDGAGPTITAVNQTGGHFVGAVVANDVSSARIEHLTVTARDPATACDAYPNTLGGIRLDGASGTISSNTVFGLQHGANSDGCQECNAIEVRNTAGATTPRVTVSDNMVTDYQKTGMLAKGALAATITGNTITGYGPVAFIAQNGIQVSAGATAQVRRTRSRGNDYSPTSYVACGLLIYQADGGRSGQNTDTAKEQNLCNIGRGGGQFSDADER